MKTGTLEAISNSATWRGNIALFDDTSGEPFDIDDVTAMTLKLRDPETGAIVLEGSLGSELAGVGDAEDGVVGFEFSASQMSAVPPNTYDLGALVTDDDGRVTQIIFGRQPVLQGL